MKRRKPLLRGLGERLKAVGDTHPGKKIRLFFQDEARAGQKGRVCHRWFTCGKRPPGRADQRYTFAYIFGAVEPGTDNAFALIMPEVSTDAMQIYLDKFAETIGSDEHVAMVLDQAGWHVANGLKVPDCITLVALPARSPELNPVERLWLYLKERFLSHRLLDDYDAIEAAIVDAWRRLIGDPGRLTSLTSYPWIMNCVRN
jgi:transposase